LSHKTIYIDIDEEITSIIDRLKKSREAEVIVVAPKRALLLQSLVNLRLLKRESDRRKKKLIIVTQDKLGKKLIEKAGIKSAGRPEGEVSASAVEDINESLLEKSAASKETNFEQSDFKRQIGSDFFYGAAVSMPVAQENENEIPEIPEKKNDIVSPASKASSQKVKKKSVRMSDIIPEAKKKAPGRKSVSTPMARQTEKNIHTPKSNSATLNSEAIIIKEDSLEKLDKNIFLTDNFAKKTDAYFGRSSIFSHSRKEKKIMDTEKVKGSAAKYFLFFLAFFAVAAVGFLAYVYLPKATVNIHPISLAKSVSKNINASASVNAVDAASGNIPAKKMEFTEKKALEYNATGSKTGKGKSGGKVIIYNEYSTEDQALVATTRLETPDGKIFRITNSAVVPGMKKSGNDNSPGSVEVEVLADQPGQEYDIAPTSFTIPGFKDSPKYQKFYAKSAANMTGGSSDEAKIVSSQDLQAAKEDIAGQIKKEAIDKIAQKMGSDEKLFEDTVKAEIISTTSSASVGDSADKFTLTADVKLQGLAVSKGDIAEVIFGTRDLGSSNIVDGENLNYIVDGYDLDNDTLSFNIKGDANENPKIDAENFKRGILGKSVESAYNYAKSYPSISKIDIQMWPYFLKKMPIFENRIIINVSE
jgi:hypothetical protein